MSRKTYYAHTLAVLNAAVLTQVMVVLSHYALVFLMAQVTKPSQKMQTHLVNLLPNLKVSQK
jgi:hypothetical protein